MAPPEQMSLMVVRAAMPAAATAEEQAEEGVHDMLGDGTVQSRSSRPRSPHNVGVAGGTSVQMVMEVSYSSDDAEDTGAPGWG